MSDLLFSGHMRMPAPEPASVRRGRGTRPRTDAAELFSHCRLLSIPIDNAHLQSRNLYQRCVSGSIYTFSSRKQRFPICRRATALRLFGCEARRVHSGFIFGVAVSSWDILRDVHVFEYASRC
jgi:hypothetical protein